MTRLSKGLVGIATSQETLISGGSGDGLETLGGRKGATGSQPRWATSSFRPMEHGRCLGGPAGKDPRVPPLHCGAVRDRGAAGLGPSVVSFPRAPSAGEPGLRGSPCARLVAPAPRAATSSAHPGDQRPARALGRRAVCAPARCAATLGAAGGPVRFSSLHCCLACRGRGSAPEGARAAGQQRPRPGSALSRSRLCRASAAQGAFGKGFRGRSGSGLGRPARPLSLCAFPRPAPGPGACGGHSLPARQPDCVLSQTRHGASDDVLDLPRASVSFPFIGDSNSTYPSGGVRVK